MKIKLAKYNQIFLVDIIITHNKYNLKYKYNNNNYNKMKYSLFLVF